MKGLDLVYDMVADGVKAEDEAEEKCRKLEVR